MSDEKQMKEIEEFIKQEHPDYPAYEDRYNKKLWSFYSQLYELQQNFDALNKFEETARLSELGITPELSFPVSGAVDRGEILLTYKSDRAYTRESVEPVFRDLRKNLSDMYPALKIVFSINGFGEELQL